MGIQSDYVIEAALGGDVAAEILAFYASQPKEGLRGIDLVEIEALVQRNLFFIARDTRDGSIVAAIYFAYRGEEDGRPVFEIGGGAVHTDHQSSGVMACLATSGLVSFMMSGTLADDETQPLARVIGRVEQSNQAPLRLLMGLGFREGDPEELPANKDGLGHMPATGGKVIARRFEFDPATLHERVEQAIAWRDGGVLKDPKALKPGQAEKTARIDLPQFAPTPEGDPLQGLLEAARRLTGKQGPDKPDRR